MSYKNATKIQPWLFVSRPENIASPTLIVRLALSKLDFSKGQDALNYSDAIQFLYQLRLHGLKLGLENTHRLADAIGRPQDTLRFIHVAGTNGKGSTCAMLESVYRAAGLRVGLFTSPHLVAFAERIQVNRQLIAERDVARLVEELRSAADFSSDEFCPTFFEAVTVMALKYFAEQKCDLVIWETGMGGRLDSTNIVTPMASVITNVQLDHQQWLGATIPEIAREKAGIIKTGIPIVTGAEGEALQVIAEAARERNAPLSIVTSVEQQAMGTFEIGLAGEHQRMNAAIVAKVVNILNGQIPVSDSVLRKGLKETQWAGRWQVVKRGGQTIVLDGAHNPGGAQALARSWRSEFGGKQGALVLGIMSDKDAAAVCQTLAPLARIIYLTKMESERSAGPQSLVAHCAQANRAARIVVCRDIADAFAQTAAEPLVLVAGSLYLVGEAMELLGLASPSPERALNENSGDIPSIRAVTFDVGGTLIEPWPSVGDVYARVAERRGIRVSAKILNERFASAWKAKKDFAHSRSDWSDLVDATFAGLTDKPPGAGFFPELYDQFTDPASWRIYEDVLPCLEQLKRNGTRLAIISNWDERLRPLLKALGLDQYFEVIVVSHDVGKGKPAPEIFRSAAQQLKLPPNAIVHVGDSRAEDFEGARAAGFRSLLLSRGRVGEAPEAISSLAELDVARLSVNKKC